MADAKIISYGKDIGAGTTVIPDNQVALDIESTDAKEYVKIDTDDSAPKVILAASGAKVSTGAQPPMCADGGLHIGIGDSGLSSVSTEQNALVIEGGDAHTGMCIVTSGAAYDAKLVFGRNGAPSAGAITYDNSTNSLGFVTNGTEQLYISSGGLISTGGETTSLGRSRGSLHILTGPDDSGGTTEAGCDDLILERGAGPGFVMLMDTTANQACSIGWLSLIHI